MLSSRFWLLFCLLILLATILFGAPVFARARKARPVVKPVAKVVVKIGHPYRAERQRPMSAADANALYLYWRDSVQFKASRKK